MNFPFYIARRYLFSKKSHNAINVISGISVCGVALATLALVCTLSVFNGFQDLVSNLFTAFDPELKIVPTTGKVFDGQDKDIAAIRKMPEVALVSESLEDNALVQYQGRQAMAVIKGVEDNFEELTPIDTILFGRGELLLHDEVVDYAIPGVQLLATLGTGIRFLDPLEVYAPKRGAKVNMANPAAFLYRRKPVLVRTGVCRESGEIRWLLYPYFFEVCPTVVSIHYRSQCHQSENEGRHRYRCL